MNQLPNELWTTKQVAKFLGITEKLLLRLSTKGNIPGGFKLGAGPQGEWRFDADQIRKVKQQYDEEETKYADMMTVAQVAKYLQMNPAAIRRLAREGNLKGVKEHFGTYPQSDWYFQKSDIRNFLTEKRKKNNT